MERYVIVNKNLVAIELFEKGYKIVKLEVNKKSGHKTVFFFKDENNIKEVIKELKIKYWDK